MNTHHEKTKKNKSQTVTNRWDQKPSDIGPIFQFVDKRPEAITQRKLQEMANASTQAKHTARLQGKVVQRIVNLTATQYSNRIVPAGGFLTQAQLGEYVKLVLNDDYGFAEGYADADIAAMGPAGLIPAGPGGGEPAAMKAWKNAIIAPVPAPANILANIAAADALGTLINTITARVTINHPAFGVPVPPNVTGVPQVIPIPNSETRYAAIPAPQTGLKHGNLRPSYQGVYAVTPGNAAAKRAAAEAAHPAISWENERDAQSKFGQAAGATLLGAPAVAPRNPMDGHVPRPSVKQLTWAQAKEFLPKPLLNLIFDVKSQLTAGANIIDERTPFERSPNVRDATSKVSGTLRSWHEDSKGMLPGNGIIGAAHGAAAAVPAAANPLHVHYAATSRTGVGAAAGAAVAPRGFAEYTGAGTTNIHNIKIVLDYITNRVYLTLSHYTYWAIVATGAGHEFIEGESQDIGLAQDKIAASPVVKAAGGHYTLMNPWIEILVP